MNISSNGIDLIRPREVQVTIASGVDHLPSAPALVRLEYLKGFPFVSKSPQVTWNIGRLFGDKHLPPWLPMCPYKGRFVFPHPVIAILVLGITYRLFQLLQPSRFLHTHGLVKRNVQITSLDSASSRVF